MIGYEYSTLFATLDEWGLVQNALKISNHSYEEPPTGWPCRFVVESMKFMGKGWNVPPRTCDWVVSYLKSRGQEVRKAYQTQD